MPATPKRRTQAQPGARWPSEVLASNVRDFRGARRMSQADLAARMSALGHGWVAATVSEVERAGRKVSVDELLSLAAVLSATIGDLLDPAGVDRRISPATERLDYGLGTLPPGVASAWVRGEVVLSLKSGRQRPDDFHLGHGSFPDPVMEAQEIRRAVADWIAERVHGREEEGQK